VTWSAVREMVPRISRPRVIALVAAIAAAASLATAPGATRRAATLWTVNGPVDSLTSHGRDVYLGGNFTQVSPRTGPLVGFSRSSGVREASFPAVESGEVTALADDGRGGWYVGGSFDRIGGVACPNLAHVTAAKTVDRRFCPRPDHAV